MVRTTKEQLQHKYQKKRLEIAKTNPSQLIYEASETTELSLSIPEYLAQGSNINSLSRITEITGRYIGKPEHQWITDACSTTVDEARQRFDVTTLSPEEQTQLISVAAAYHYRGQACAILAKHFDISPYMPPLQQLISSIPSPNLSQLLLHPLNRYAEQAKSDALIAELLYPPIATAQPATAPIKAPTPKPSTAPAETPKKAKKTPVVPPKKTPKKLPGTIKDTAATVIKAEPQETIIPSNITDTAAPHLPLTTPLHDDDTAGWETQNRKKQPKKDSRTPTTTVMNAAAHNKNTPTPRTKAAPQPSNTLDTSAFPPLPVKKEKETRKPAQSTAIPGKLDDKPNNKPALNIIIPDEPPSDITSSSNGSFSPTTSTSTLTTEQLLKPQEIPYIPQQATIQQAPVFILPHPAWYVQLQQQHYYQQTIQVFGRLHHALHTDTLVPPQEFDTLYQIGQQQVTETAYPNICFMLDAYRLAIQPDTLTRKEKQFIQNRIFGLNGEQPLSIDNHASISNADWKALINLAAPGHQQQKQQRADFVGYYIIPPLSAMHADIRNSILGRGEKHIYQRFTANQQMMGR